MIIKKFASRDVIIIEIITLIFVYPQRGKWRLKKRKTFTGADEKDKQETLLLLLLLLISTDWNF